MVYAVFVGHPESQARRIENFTRWNFWSRENAPWIGLNIHTVAAVLEELSKHPVTEDLRDNLDYGGSLSADEADRLLRLAGTVLPDEAQRVFQFAAHHRYPVLVEYTNPIGLDLHASELHRGPFGDTMPDPDPHSDAVDLGPELAAFYAPAHSPGAQEARPVLGLPRGYSLLFAREGQSVLRYETTPVPWVYLQQEPGGEWHRLNPDGSLKGHASSFPDAAMQHYISTDSTTGGRPSFRWLYPVSISGSDSGARTAKTGAKEAE